MSANREIKIFHTRCPTSAFDTNHIVILLVILIRAVSIWYLVIVVVTLTRTARTSVTWLKLRS